MDQCRENYKIIRDVSIFIIIFVLMLWIITLTWEVSSAMILISITSSTRPEMDYLLIPRVVPGLNEHIALRYHVWMALRIGSVRPNLTMALLIVLKCWCYYPSPLMKWLNSCVCTQKFGSWIVPPVSLHHWSYKYISYPLYFMEIQFLLVELLHFVHVFGIPITLKELTGRRRIYFLLQCVQQEEIPYQ